MKKVFLFIFCGLCWGITWGQEAFDPSTIVAYPSSPGVYEFQKHLMVKNSTYTGTINYSIPICNISIRNLDLPIAINYASNGIKVDEIASEVGLGWSLSNPGQIVQMVNGIDDFYPGTKPANHYMNQWHDFPNLRLSEPIKWRPDYYGSSWFQALELPRLEKMIQPYYHDHLSNLINNPSEHRFPYFPDFPSPDNLTPQLISYLGYLPHAGRYKATSINGWFDSVGVSKSVPSLFDGSNDHEPDVFQANILGEQLEFMYLFDTGELKILNEKTGYRIERINRNKEIEDRIADYYFRVRTPDGLTIYFEKDERVKGGAFGVFGRDILKSRIWKVTKIENIYGENVNIML